MIKLLIFIIVLYLGYRLVVGPPLLGRRDSGRIRKDKEEDGFTDYEELP